MEKITTELTPGWLSKTALLICATLPTLAFVLLLQALHRPMAWIIAGILLGVPGMLALRYRQFHAWVLPANTTAIMLVVVIASFNLWQSLLAGERADLSLHLLALLLSLVLAITQQLLILANHGGNADAGVNDLIEESLRGPSITIGLCIGLILADLFLTVLHTSQLEIFTTLAPKFLQRGYIPPLTLTLFCWGSVLLAGKWLLMLREIQLGRDNNSGIHLAYDKVRHSTRKTASLTAAIWQKFEGFYVMPRYINWAMPILGFIGTVLGISLATEGLSAVLASHESEFSQMLGDALSPLGIAFDTTLIALSLSVVLALGQTLLYRWEERYLMLLEEDLN